MLVFNGKKSLKEIKRWRDDFRSRVNKLSGDKYLQLTCEICIPNPIPLRKKQDNISDIATNTFPYLNLEFFWNADRELEFQVYRKTKQKLKYMNKGITHTNATLKKTPTGIFNRLAKLTSRTKKTLK